MTTRVSRWQEVLNRHLKSPNGEWCYGNEGSGGCDISLGWPCPDAKTALAGVAADEQIAKHLQAIRDRCLCPKCVHDNAHRNRLDAVAALALLEPPTEDTT